MPGGGAATGHMYLSGNLAHVGGSVSFAASDIGMTCNHPRSWQRKMSPPGPPPRTVPATHESACATTGVLRSPEAITEATAISTALITN
jgi:hypothetical protein